MEEGNFYFIKDDFFSKYDKVGNLMQNKANGNARPCLVAFQDKNMNDIYWCIPISSQVEKYDSIYKKKIQNQINKGIKNPKCDTICFGNVLGKKRAFLIQNMFPVSKECISNIYL